MHIINYYIYKLIIVNYTHPRIKNTQNLKKKNVRVVMMNEQIDKHNLKHIFFVHYWSFE